jgi:predicted nuclease of restriction endonuclease-like (RecB) superfamily
MTFDQLTCTLESVQSELSARASQQVNTALTVRNWLIGFYLVEFEQNGDDRAIHGQRIMERTAQRLRHVKGMTIANLFNFRNLYLSYRWFSGYVLADIAALPILQTASVKLTQLTESETDGTIDRFRLPAERLLTTLTFSHFIELIRLDSELKRRFYEVEAVKNSWTVKELTRATTTLLFERTGLSTDKAAVIGRIATEKPGLSADRMRSPYVLEFLNLAEKAEYSENDLESAILTHIQDFLTELGRGFCFEARQRRITFGNTHYYIDLVFYHRILKCHVLIDLKIGRFDHGDAGQMNLYLNYYKANEMTEGDNPPVGLILCADKDDSLVEYATGGMSNELFVSKYQLQLPDQQILLRLIQADLDTFGSSANTDASLPDTHFTEQADIQEHVQQTKPGSPIL